MHNFIYPQKDLYITNEAGYSSKNLGIDELLEVKSKMDITKVYTIYTSQSVSATYTSSTRVYKYTGTIDGRLSGSVVSSSLVLTSSVNIASGSFTGYLSGSCTGSAITGSLTGSSLHLVGAATGTLSGSWVGTIIDAVGYIEDFTGYVSGTLAGSQSIYTPRQAFSYTPTLSRILLKFDVSTLSASIFNGNISNTGSMSFVLKLRATEANEIPLQYTIYGYPVSQSWQMGVGRYETSGSNKGASWLYRNFSGETGSFWYPTSSLTTFLYNDYLTNSTYQSESFSKGGGTWYYTVPSNYSIISNGFCSGIVTGSGLICSQSFDYQSTDISMDITSIVKSWICGCVPNEGIILLTSQELEYDPTNNFSIRFFSKDTNTIYTPYIDVGWDDSTYITGTLTPLTSSIPYTVVLKNLQESYKFGDVSRINVFARDTYPLKNFRRDTQFNQYLTSSLLPSQSYYSVVDNHTDRVLIDFDNNTKLSCDGTIHYFILDTTNFTVERDYRIKLKVIYNGETKIIDTQRTFKITR